MTNFYAQFQLTLEPTTVLLSPFAHVAAMPALTVKTVTQFYKPRK